MKRKRKQGIIAMINFLYIPATIIFSVGKPIFIARNDEEIVSVINDINSEQKRKIYLLNHPYPCMEILFKTKEWHKIKNELRSLKREEELEKLEYFLLYSEQGIWN